MSDLYERQKRYYELRAGEYDATSWEPLGEAHADEVARVVEVLSALSPARTVDVACGTGFLSQRAQFLEEARRVGEELILVQELQGAHHEGQERRDLRDGSS